MESSDAVSPGWNLAHMHFDPADARHVLRRDPHSALFVLLSATPHTWTIPSCTVTLTVAVGSPGTPERAAITCSRSALSSGLGATAGGPQLDHAADWRG